MTDPRILTTLDPATGAGPEGVPTNAAAPFPTDPAFTPGRHPAQWTDDTLFILDVRDHQDMLDQGGRMKADYTAYWDKTKAPGALVDGPWAARKAIGENSGGGATPCVQIDGLIRRSAWTIRYDFRAKAADLTAVAGTLRLLSIYGRYNVKEIDIISVAGVISARMFADNASVPKLVASATAIVGDVPSGAWRTLLITYRADEDLKLYLIDNATTLRTSVLTTSIGRLPPEIPITGRASDYGLQVMGAGDAATSGAIEGGGELQVYAHAHDPETGVDVSHAGNPKAAITVRPATTINGRALRNLAGLSYIYADWSNSTIDTPTAAKNRDVCLDRLDQPGLPIRIFNTFDRLGITDNGVGATPRYTYNWVPLDDQLQPLEDRGHPFYLTLAWVPAVVQSVPGNLFSPPTSDALLAQLCSDLVGHVLSQFDQCLPLFSFFNEPQGFLLTNGWTTSSFVACWRTVHDKVFADHGIHIGSSDGNWGDATWTAWVDHCVANNIVPGAMFQHDYLSDLGHSAQELEAMRNYPKLKGADWSGVPILVTEWSWDWSYYGGRQELALGRSLWFQNDVMGTKFAAYMFAFMKMMADEGVTFATYFFLAQSGHQAYCGAWTSDDPPRPREPWPALQAMYKLGAQRIQAKTTRPNLHALATVDTDGTITVAYCSYRPWRQSDRLPVALDINNLPTRFTWKRWDVDDAAMADCRMCEVAAGNQDSMPVGFELQACGLGVIQITPA